MDPGSKFVAAAMLGLAIAAHAQDKTRGEPCLAPATWYVLERDALRAVQARDLLQQMAAREVVLLGERHENASHHQWQLQTLAALHVLRPDMVIGFESFPRRVQPVLDRWIAGELSVQQFLAQTEWTRVWNFAPDLYLPLFQFARLNRIPMVALNVERTLTQAVRSNGWDAVPAEEKEGVSRPAPVSEAYRDVLYEAFRQHAREAKGGSAGQRDGAAFRHFVEAQLTWDRAMAEALAARVAGAAGTRQPLAVGIMGSGHVRGGHGVPHQLRALGVHNVGVLLPADASRDCNKVGDGIADAVFAMPGLPREDAPRPRLGVRLEEAAGEVRLADVVAGSLAEKSGLQRGDHIVSIAGQPVTAMAAVIAAVRAQPPGTWLPLEVRRNRKTLELVVRFPQP